MVAFGSLHLDSTLQFEAEALRDALSVWRSLRKERALPPRDAIDPLMLRKHLGWLLLVDVQHGPERFRYRLIGTGFTELLGRDTTGRYLDEIYGAEMYESMIASYRWVVRHRQPMRVTGTLHRAQDTTLAFETLDLPFGTDDRPVELIMTRGVLQPLG